MRAYLVFQLYGPMASWGDVAVGEERDSHARPTKSALVGLLAAALGLRREQHEAIQQLAEAYHYSSKVLAAGTPLTDYHTVQSPPSDKKVTLYTRRDHVTRYRRDELHTLISTREYLTDALVIVAVHARDVAPRPLAVIAEALRRPHFQLYLGRKSCPPALPLQPIVAEHASVKDALDEYQCLSQEVYRQFVRKDSSDYYWSHDDEVLQKTATLYRFDEPRDRLRWQFAPRSEYHHSGTGGADD